jgi:hypothetical protein
MAGEDEEQETKVGGTLVDSSFVRKMKPMLGID